jgi:hypothetical protein
MSYLRDTQPKPELASLINPKIVLAGAGTGAGTEAGAGTGARSILYGSYCISLI